MDLSMEKWNEMYEKFVYDLTENGFSLEGSLHNFIERYEEYRTQEEEVEEEEPLDLYFERKMKPMWDYVYNVQKQYTELRTRVTKLEEASRPFGPAYLTYVGHPAGSPPQVPNTYKPAQPPLDRYKVTCANGNVPLGNDAAITSGYMNIVEPKYTQEEIESWNNIRFDDPAKRK